MCFGWVDSPGLLPIPLPARYNSGSGAGSMQARPEDADALMDALVEELGPERAGDFIAGLPPHLLRRPETWR